MDLLKRREKIVAANAAAEEKRGSGWHPGDLGAEARDSELKLSKRPVALQDDDQVYVVGPDVAVVQAALKRFIDQIDAAMRDWQGRVDAARAAGKSEPEAPDLLQFGQRYQAQVVRYARKVLSQSAQIQLPTQEWNYANTALAQQGVQVSSATAYEG